jgi:hypothetical protein
MVMAGGHLSFKNTKHLYGKFVNICESVARGEARIERLFLPSNRDVDRYSDQTMLKTVSTTLEKNGFNHLTYLVECEFEDFSSFEESRNH